MITEKEMLVLFLLTRFNKAKSPAKDTTELFQKPIFLLRFY